MGKPGSVTIAPQSRHLPGVMFMCAVLAPALTMIFFIVLRAGHDALWLDASLAYADLEFAYFVALPMTILMAVPLGLIPAWLWLSMARRAALRLGGRRPAFIAACALSGLTHALFV